MNGKALRVAAGLVLLLAGAGGWYQFNQHRQAESERRARAVLEHALTDGRRVPYEGVKVVRGLSPAGGEPIQQRARELVAGDGRSRIEYLAGADVGLTVWEDGERIWRIHASPDRCSVARSNPADLAAAERLKRELILANYIPRLRGREPVAGREAAVLELRSPHPGRPWQRLWVDEETGVPLASRHYDAQGRELLFSRFEEFRVLPEPPPAASFEPPSELKQRARLDLGLGSTTPLSAEALSEAVGFPVPVPAALPAGFAWMAGYLHPCNHSGCEKRFARIEFTDGLNLVQLYAAGHGCEGEVSCLGSGAAPEAQTRRVGDIICVVVGDLPPRELQRMLDSLPAS